MKPFRFRLAAERELHEIRRYYEAEKPGLGDRWMEAAEGELDYLGQSSKRGRLTDLGARMYHMKDFPYFIVFMEKSSHLLVVASMHEKRRPNYWKGRI